MHELPKSRSGLGGSIIRMDRLEGRRRCVLQQQLHVFRDSLTEDFGDGRQGEIHACGDAAARDDVAIADDATFLDYGSEQSQRIARRPIGGGALAA